MKTFREYIQEMTGIPPEALPGNKPSQGEPDPVFDSPGAVKQIVKEISAMMQQMTPAELLALRDGLRRRAVTRGMLPPGYVKSGRTTAPSDEDIARDELAAKMQRGKSKYVVDPRSWRQQAEEEPLIPSGRTTAPSDEDIARDELAAKMQRGKSKYVVDPTKPYSFPRRGRSWRQQAEEEPLIPSYYQH